eukprot:gene16718-biopygen9786
MSAAHLDRDQFTCLLMLSVSVNGAIGNASYVGAPRRSGDEDVFHSRWAPRTQPGIGRHTRARITQDEEASAAEFADATPPRTAATRQPPSWQSFTNSVGAGPELGAAGTSAPTLGRTPTGPPYAFRGPAPSALAPVGALAHAALARMPRKAGKLQWLVSSGTVHVCVAQVRYRATSPADAHWHRGCCYCCGRHSRECRRPHPRPIQSERRENHDVEM